MVVIGCSKLESGERGTQLGGDDKDINACFDRKLYIPAPNYATRTMMWTKFMRDALGKRMVCSCQYASANNYVCCSLLDVNNFVFFFFRKRTTKFD